jgi:hypothetical protein
MKLLITESQYTKLLLEYYDSEKLHSREYVVDRLSKGPRYMRQYIKNLPYIECEHPVTKKPHICTQVPEVVYQFLTGNF